jgi:hypothetical protein
MPRRPRELRRALDASAMLRQAVTEVVDNLTGTADGGIFCGTISFDSICSEPHPWGSLSFGPHQAARPRRRLSSPRNLDAVLSRSTYGSLPI